MPTEYRFDDLDLREQPARGDVVSSDFVTRQNQTCGSAYCGPSDLCTQGCCTETCP